MFNPLTMKLEQFTPFTAEERRRLNALLDYPKKTYARGAAIIAQGEKVGCIHLVLEGLATRSKILPDGNRQLMAFLVPGDLCDLEVFVLEAMDHSIIALTDTVCVSIPAAVIEGLLTESSSLTKALWWSTMTDSAVLREWIVGHGSRDALARVAHLICEMLIRYRIIGETTDDSFPFPVTQEEWAEATGMTSVHLNRIIGQLRSDGLIEINNKGVTVLDVDRLMALAQFDPNYLHLTRTERRDPSVSGRAGDLVPAVPGGLFQDVIHKVKAAVTSH